MHLRRRQFTLLSGLGLGSLLWGRSLRAQSIGTLLFVPTHPCQVKIDGEEWGTLPCGATKVPMTLGDHFIVALPNQPFPQGLIVKPLGFRVQITSAAQIVQALEFSAGCRKCRETGRRRGPCEPCSGTGQVRRTCNSCYGSGRDCSTGYPCGNCRACNGSGEVRVDCSRCHGSGIDRFAFCDDCNGRGSYPIRTCG